MTSRVRLGTYFQQKEFHRIQNSDSMTFHNEWNGLYWAIHIDICWSRLFSYPQKLNSSGSSRLIWLRHNLASAKVRRSKSVKCTSETFFYSIRSSFSISTTICTSYVLYHTYTWIRVGSIWNDFVYIDGFDFLLIAHLCPPTTVDISVDNGRSLSILKTIWFFQGRSARRCAKL